MANYYSNPIFDDYLNKLNEVKALFDLSSNPGQETTIRVSNGMQDARRASDIFLAEPVEKLNLKDDFSELTRLSREQITDIDLVAKIVTRWERKVKELTGKIIIQLIEEARALTLNISSLPNLDAIQLDDGSFQYDLKPQPSTLAGGDVDLSSNIPDSTPIDNRYILQRESLTGITTKQYDDAQETLNTRLRERSDGPFNKLNEFIASAKLTIPDYDVDIISRLQTNANKLGFTTIFQYVKQFRTENGEIQEIDREQINALNNYTLNYTYNNGIKAVVSLINEQIDYVEAQMLLDSSKNPNDLLQIIIRKQKQKFNEYVLEGLPYVGRQDEYLYIYPFSYEDLIQGSAGDNSVNIFSLVEPFMVDAIKDLKKEFKLIAEYKTNTRISDAKQLTPEPPPGWSYNNDGTLSKIVVDTAVRSADTRKTKSNFVPHLMYNPRTGEAFMASSYELHVAYGDLGYIHGEPSFAQLDSAGDPIVPTPTPFPAEPTAPDEEDTTSVATPIATASISTPTYTPPAPSSGGGGGGGY
tara:strand:+ start:2948 stop:4528 length:1581 start_codon:yes stop_codon:yes gene_type:complete